MSTPLRRERERMGLSTVTVADALGVSQSTITRIENGILQPRPDLATRIATYFDQRITRDQVIFPRDYPECSPKKAKVA